MLSIKSHPITHKLASQYLSLVFHHTANLNAHLEKIKCDVLCTHRIWATLTCRALSCIQCNWLSTPLHVSLLVCTWHKADIPPQQTCATKLAPWEVCRRKAEVCSGANDTCMVLSSRSIKQLRNWPTSALADSAVGVAILTCHGRSQLQKNCP